MPEVWLRGPLPEIPVLLQPVAHALLQAREEINEMMMDFPEEKLWAGVAGLASPGFHLQHLAGVLNRLFTYAQGNMLSEGQLAYLASEGKDHQPKVAELVEAFNKGVDQALQQLSKTDEQMLMEVRAVGRQRASSTVIGLLVHAAEHTMRHTGQLLVTVKVLKG